MRTNVPAASSAASLARLEEARSNKTVTDRRLMAQTPIINAVLLDKGKTPWRMPIVL